LRNRLVLNFNPTCDRIIINQPDLKKISAAYIYLFDEGLPEFTIKRYLTITELPTACIS
jgi:hypothetical protein